MRMYGNIMNRIAETIPPSTPTVGMGATILMWSDRYPATIVAVKDKQITLQEDTATRTDKNGMSESQQYEFKPNPDGRIFNATLRKNGTYVLEGGSMRSGTIIRIGRRDRYYDFSF